MLEQLLDFVAVGGGAVLVVTGRSMHQQGHGTLQLLLPLPPLRVCQPHLQLIDTPHLSLQQLHAFMAVPCNESSALRLIHASARRHEDVFMNTVWSVLLLQAVHRLFQGEVYVVSPRYRFAGKEHAENQHGGIRSLISCTCSVIWHQSCSRCCASAYKPNIAVGTRDIHTCLYR